MAKVGTLNLLGNEWTIVTDKDLPEDLHGLALLDAKKIILAEGLDKKAFRIAYIHESLHGMLCEASFGAIGLSVEAEEMIVDLLAKQIVANFEAIKRHLA
jgi:hypothetical protein